MSHRSRNIPSTGRWIAYLIFIVALLSLNAQAEPDPPSGPWFHPTKRAKIERGFRPLPTRHNHARLTTAQLLYQEVERYPMILIRVGAPSPFDRALLGANLRAGELLDLWASELGEIRVNQPKP